MDIFDIEPRKDIMARVIRWQLAKKRSGNHKVKSRSEVKSTTAKFIDKREQEGLDMDLHQLFNLEVVELYMDQLLEITVTNYQKK